MRELGIQFTKFAGVGAIGTVAHYFVLVVLVSLAGTNAVLASGLGFAVGAIVNYTLNYKCTFNSSERHQVAAPKFLSVCLVGISLNLLIMYALTSALGVYYLLAQVIATGVVLIWNFLGNRFWTFRSDLALPRPAGTARNTRI